MVSALPGPQPIDFNTPPLLLCDCDSIPPTLIDIDDVLVFQFRKEACADDAVIFDGLVGAVVDGMGWTYLIDGSLRVTPGLGTINGTFPFVPAPGATYRIVVGDLILSGGHFTISCGGHSFDIGTPGFSTIIFTAITAAPLVLTSYNDSKFILSGLVITDFGAALQVAITDTEGGVTTINYGSNHSLFSFSGDRVTAMIPMSDTHINAEQCFTVTVTDGCDGGSGSGSGSGSDGELVSQRLRAIRPDCRTLTVRTCLDEDAMGFAPFAPRVLVPAQLGRPTWKHDVAEQRGVDGRHMTTYADRVTSLALRIGALGYHDHNYLSSLPEWDHVYLYSQGTIVEVQPDGEAYEPAYADSDSVGSVEIAFRLKEELVRNVNCGAEGDGCNPASDPICNTADVSFTFNLDGSAMNITLNGITSFVPGDVTVTVGSGTPTVHTFDTENLPDTITIGSLPNDTYDIVVHIADASRAECFDERILHHLFRCVGDGIGTITVGTGSGAGSLKAVSSSGYFAVREAGSGVFAVHASSTTVVIPEGGTYCLWPCDEDGAISGDITDINPLSGGVTGYDFSDLGGLLRLNINSVPVLETVQALPPSLTSFLIGTAPLVTELPPLHEGLTSLSVTMTPLLEEIPNCPSTLTSVYFWGIPLVDTLPAWPSGLLSAFVNTMDALLAIPAHPSTMTYIYYANLPLVSSIPATGAAMVSYDINNTAGAGMTTIGDFSPSAETIVRIGDTVFTFGVLPKITALQVVSGWSNATSTTVDQLINALDATVANGTCILGAINLALRTSASDTNYNDCLANGWTFS